MSNQETDPEIVEYLSEFKSILKFDDEDCPVCGIDISSTLKPVDSFFAEIASFDNKENSRIIVKYLEENNIEALSELREGLYILKVRVFEFERAKKLLQEFKENMSS